MAATRSPTLETAAPSGAVERFARRIRADLDEPLRVLADACLTRSDRLDADVSGAAASIVEYLRTLEARVDENGDGRRGPGPRLTMALASELSFIARHMDAPLAAPAVERLQPRVRRAARLATLWLTPYEQPGTTTTGPDSESTVAWTQRPLAAHGAVAEPEPAAVEGTRDLDVSTSSAVAEIGAASRTGRDAAALDAVDLVRRRIQELRERAELLEERGFLQDRYWRFATHELRNAAHALVLGLERIATTDAGAAPWMQPLMRSAEAVVRRSEEALDDRRVSRGVFELHPQAVDLVEVALSALQNARDLAVQGDVRLVAERLPVGEPVWAMADAGRVEQILHNLLRNAIHAAPPGGFVLMECGHRDGEAVVVVSDSGPGVADEAAARLFALDAEARTGTGFGLGLPLSRHLARAMGGDVELLPAQSGLGGRFQLRLPRGHA